MNDIEKIKTYDVRDGKSDLSTPDDYGWRYDKPPPEGDCRKFVWLDDGQWAWTGVRAYDSQNGQWLCNNEPEKARVLCWQDLPQRPQFHWSHGKLVKSFNR